MIAKKLWKLVFVFVTFMVIAACGNTQDIEGDMSPQEEPVNGNINQEEPNSEVETEGSFEGETNTEDPASSEGEDESLETEMKPEENDNSELDAEIDSGLETENSLSDEEIK
ncbi:hypothetical protein [Mesobacillus maritimus]|uniref:Lipoprotein n=1 Tax=Mesobacillus maritimus TaxID=1643336 RepID=A0ABS7K1A5_9BACI|nr:hypothetical protein [Mesobacillus maritimus]MBY0095969.1 hypothetical protein [Mesobacillus maritimus]